ncbi:MAG: hypothetical protein BWZ10_01468 [candidate division BRC1 bacterium ADurb.BinA364]|nr:MAG: hypothetical protein BWZ10_01468 [candidate division BRC1 bacterium ADurb.BinA364]
MKLHDVLARQRLDRRLVAFGRVAVGVAFVQRLEEFAIGVAELVVFAAADGAQDQFALFFDFLGGKRGFQRDIGQKAQRHIQVRHRRHRVDFGVILGDGNVDLAADGFDGQRDLLGRAAARAFQQQVLRQIGQAFLADGILGRSAGDEQVQGQNPIVGSRRDDQPHAVLQCSHRGFRFGVAGLQRRDEGQRQQRAQGEPALPPASMFANTLQAPGLKMRNCRYQTKQV